MNKKNLIWIAQIAVALLIGQTLVFKFTDSPETVALFAELGLGPIHYKTLALLELTAVILILIPRTVTIGALLATGLMSGALMAHITKLGFTGPNGQLGIIAAVVWTLAIAVLMVRRNEIPFSDQIAAWNEERRLNSMN